MPLALNQLYSKNIKNLVQHRKGTHMSNRIKRPVFTFIGTVFSFILLSGCIVHVGASPSEYGHSGSDYSSVNKSLKVSDGKEVGDLSSVNGRLSVGDRVSAEDISSVNGSLSIGSNVSAEDVSTVNGRLSASEGLRVSGDLTSVNGGISVARNSEILGDVTSVNGSIKLNGVTVGKNVETVNASIDILAGSQIKGNIVYQKTSRNNNYRGKNPKLSISADSSLDGQIILYREVDLDIDNSDLMKKVVRKY